MDSTIFPAIYEYDCKLPYYVGGIGSGCLKGPYKKEKGFPLYQWMHARTGEGIMHIGGKEYKLKEHTGILIFPNQPYELQITSNYWTVDWIVFDGYAVNDFFKSLNVNEMKIYKLTNYKNIYYKFERLLRMSTQVQIYKCFDTSCAVYDFLINIAKNITFPQLTLKSYPRLDEVYAYIEEHYNEIIMLEDLSEITGTSPQYFSKLFKELTGFRVVEYINCVRIRKSKELMFRYGDMKVTEIAIACGFEDASYFCSVFRKLEGITPGEFRKKFFEK